MNSFHLGIVELVVGHSNLTKQRWKNLTSFCSWVEFSKF